MAEENVNIFTSHDVPKRSFKYFEEMRNKKELCDLNIQVGSESISVHRIIITAVIPHFRALLSSKSLKTGEKGIVLPDINPSALKSLIEFAYTCQVRISEENARSLLSAACYFHVDEVRDACFDFLWSKIDPENVLNVRDLVADLNCSDLSTKVDCYVRKNFEKVSQTKDFLRCSPSYLKELIEKDDLNVTEEKIVFQSIMKWVKASPDDRKVYLPDLLTNVRMASLKPLYLTRVIKDEELVRTSFTCRDLIDEARNYISFPEKRSSKCSFTTQPRKTLATTDVGEEQGSLCVWKLHFELTYAVQHFNTANRLWASSGSQSFISYDGSAVEMHNKIYFFRWGDALQFNQANNEYKFLSDVPTPRTFTGASCLEDKIYLCGGRIGRVASNSVECFNPKMNVWSKTCSMPKSLWGTSVVTLGAYIFVLGGQDHRAMCSSVERYDPRMNKWEYMPPMNYKRSFAGAAVIDCKIYVCGGNISVDSITTTATSEVYNPITKSWGFISNMNSPRCLFSLLPCGEKLYVIGGKHDGKIVDYCEIYDTKSKKWTFGLSTETKMLTSAAVGMTLDGRCADHC